MSVIIIVALSDFVSLLYIKLFAEGGPKKSLPRVIWQWSTALVTTVNSISSQLSENNIFYKTADQQI